MGSNNTCRIRVALVNGRKQGAIAAGVINENGIYQEFGMVFQ